MFFTTVSGSTYVVDESARTVTGEKIGTVTYKEGFNPVIMVGERAFFPLVNGELKTSVVESVHA